MNSDRSVISFLLVDPSASAKILFKAPVCDTAAAAAADCAMAPLPRAVARAIMASLLAALASIVAAEAAAADADAWAPLPGSRAEEWAAEEAVNAPAAFGERAG